MEFILLQKIVFETSTKMILVVAVIPILFAQVVYSQYWTGSEYYTTNKFDSSLNKNRMTHCICDDVTNSFDNRIYPNLQSIMEFNPTHGGGLSVISGSLNRPIGISITSENAYAGILTVAGKLPFTGVTMVNGMLPSDGTGIINHICDNDLNASVDLGTISSPTFLKTAGYVVPYSMTIPASNIVGLNSPSGLMPAGLSQPVCAGASNITPSWSYANGFLDSPYTIEFTATKGGTLPVASSSAIPPTGIAISSDTKYQGILAATGELPFVGTVKVDGRLPTAGTGTINYVCGNDVNMSAGYGYYVDYPRKGCTHRIA